MRFLNFINEAANAKLGHLEHLEDYLLNDGIEGAATAIEFLTRIYHGMEGKAKAPLNVSTKWDGSPALVFGIDPTTKRFFISLKQSKKICYTNADVDEFFQMGDLNNIMKIALRYLPTLGVKKVYHGDLMFIKPWLKEVEQDGQKLLTFKPNTITYAVPADSDLAKQIKDSKMGIVLHTTYEGADIKSMVASPGVKEVIKSSHDVWCQSETFSDMSGSITFTASESTQMKTMLAKLAQDYKQLNIDLVNRARALKIFDYMKTFNNANIRGGALPNAQQYLDKFFTYYSAVKTKDLEKNPTPARTTNTESAIRDMKAFLTSHKQFLEPVIQFYNDLITIKNFVIEKFSAGSKMKTFIQTEDGLKVTKPEGFVAIDSNGSFVKLVDRLEFSSNNFANNAARKERT